MDITYVTIDNGPYEEYLGKSNMDITVLPSTDLPAREYNKIIRRTDAQYICFIHSDVTTSGMHEAIERSIAFHPDFGALGAVGVLNGYKWGRKGVKQEVMTLDSCCLVINTEYGL